MHRRLPPPVSCAARAGIALASAALPAIAQRGAAPPSYEDTVDFIRTRVEENSALVQREMSTSANGYSGRREIRARVEAARPCAIRVVRTTATEFVHRQGGQTRTTSSRTTLVDLGVVSGVRTSTGRFATFSENGSKSRYIDVARLELTAKPGMRFPVTLGTIPGERETTATLELISPSVADRLAVAFRHAIALCTSREPF